MEKDLHTGHRNRVRKKFLESGFTDATPKHEILEMILFYSVPRKDTNALAHELLIKFGSLSGVLNASASELMKFPGVTENTVALFKLIMETSRVYQAESMSKGGVFSSADEMGTYLLGRFAGVTEEQVAMLCLQNNGKFISFDIISHGDVSAVGVSSRKVVETVIERQAGMVVLAHNHPGGIALPSKTDLESTRRISEVLRHIGVRLFDHVVIADGDFVSFRQSEQLLEYLGEENDL